MIHLIIMERLPSMSFIFTKRVEYVYTSQLTAGQIVFLNFKVTVIHSGSQELDTCMLPHVKCMSNYMYMVPASSGAKLARPSLRPQLDFNIKRNFPLSFFFPSRRHLKLKSRINKASAYRLLRADIRSLPVPMYVFSTDISDYRNSHNTGNVNHNPEICSPKIDALHLVVL